jgi:hypothetical protein
MANTPLTSIDVAEILAIDEAVLRSTAATPFGITRQGFYPKPFARLLAEKLALARALFGADLDLTAGSAIRKILELSALEDARGWAALAAQFDDSFAATAVGEALSRHGEEIGLPRPFLEARGQVLLRLVGQLPNQATNITLPRGARLLSVGGNHAALDETVTLSTSSPERQAAAVVAFFPGPEGNLDPAQPNQRLENWNFSDPELDELKAAQDATGGPIVSITHTQPFTGGNLQWPDERYRQLILSAPRSLWTADAVRLAVSMVPGVRQVQIRDSFGGLDINQSIFGNFNFIERVFGSERDLGSPYYFTILVAPMPSAFWDGPDGLLAAVTAAIEDIRPIGIFANIQEAEEIGIGVACELILKGLPMPSGSRQVINASQPAEALKARLSQRVRAYMDALNFGEPVRVAEVTWALMNEPGVADVQNLQLLRYPPRFDSVTFTTTPQDPTPQALDCGVNVELQANQIPVFVKDSTRMTII